MMERMMGMRTLVYIPRMFSKNEFRNLVNFVPDNFDDAAHEFWSYVNERLIAMANRIQHLYSDLSNLSQKNISEYEKDIVTRLIDHGATLAHIENPMLMAEAHAWLKMMEKSSIPVLAEMYLACVQEIHRQVVHMIDNSLLDGEMGVLFVDSQLQISFPNSIRVIRMFPFNPQDYIKRHRVKRQSRS
ncbi:MAG: hypothetical protein JSV76_04160 [Candidatus Bathyarchaeota archaeon]|nr:MAG: hypothetical protein JSV76_04160 [Candidatus Bathyarchaeota archaeon]